jgi:hypothetical protein
MGLLDGHAETYTLTDIRRFTANTWESGASLALRDGNLDALAEYDRHGRLLGHDNTSDAVEAAATAAVADRVDGRTTVVVTATNEQAAAIATQVRDQLIDLGIVNPDRGVLLGRDGSTASVGDLVAPRRNDYGLGVTNRDQYVVTDVGDDGSLTVTPASKPSNEQSGHPGERTEAAVIVLPAEYVAEDVQLGYASTVHAAQGLTVDAAHLVTDGTLNAPTLYVAMTRGRLRNTAHVALNTATSQDTRASARAVLETGLERDSSSRAATVEAELDAERLSSMSVLAGRLEAVTRAACRERLDRHLDHLTDTGVLDETTRARLGADQGTEHLSRLLPAMEQAGEDPLTVLSEAIEQRSLTDADSVAQLLAHRIVGNRPLPAPVAGDQAEVDDATTLDDNQATTADATPTPTPTKRWRRPR